MGGTGRAYSRRMGITKLIRSNGSEVTVADNHETGFEEVTVAKGDKIEFKIDSSDIPKELYGEKVKIDDINTNLVGQREAADISFQLGEIYAIGRTYWRVIDRSRDFWMPNSDRPSTDTEDKSQIITLECTEEPIEPGRGNRIGLVNQGKIISPSQGFVGDLVTNDDDLTTNFYAPGPGFYPVLRQSRGIVRNSRACEVTEIGIKSRVYQNLNGVTNFQSLPVPQELINFDDDDIRVTTGVMNIYVKRASCFVVEVRQIGASDDNWYLMRDAITQGEMIYAVIGNQPVDQYNYLTFYHPVNLGLSTFEYRFVPLTGAAFHDFDRTKRVVVLGNQLDASNKIQKQIATTAGTFTLVTNGVIKTRADIQRNREFANDSSGTVTTRTPNYPSSLSILNRFPDTFDSNNDSVLTAVEKIAQYSEPIGVPTGRVGAYYYEIFGDANSGTFTRNDGSSVNKANLPVGGRLTSDYRREYVAGTNNNKWINIQYVVEKKEMPAGHASGQAYSFKPVHYNIYTQAVAGSSRGGWDMGAEFTIILDVSGGNPFKNTGGGTMTKTGFRFKVTGLSERPNFTGRQSAYNFALFGDANSDANRGTTKTVYKTHTSGSQVIKVGFTSTSIVTSQQFREKWGNEPRYNYAWNAPEISIVRASPTTANWDINDTFEISENASGSNPYIYDDDLKIGYLFRVEARSDSTVTVSTYNSDRTFEGHSQYADISFYDGVDKSNQGSPEHQIMYVNEALNNDAPPRYDKITMAGLALKASKSFSSLDQIRFWLSKGIPVKRFHPDLATNSDIYGDTATSGPSNLLTDLIYYLLTDRTAGLGTIFNPSTTYAENLIDTTDLANTSKFLYTNRLFFNGAIDSPKNIRQFISNTAPNFLCNFVINNGKFSIRPAVPVESDGSISLGAIDIKQLFTGGNILEDTFQINYLTTEERQQFKAVMRYQEQKKNQLPEEKTVVVSWASNNVNDPFEDFDLTRFATTKEHAVLVGKFFLSIRKHVTHTVSFKTVFDDLSLAPGDFIKINTEASPYTSANNGTVSATGVIVSARTMEDSNSGYEVTYYASGTDDVQDGTMIVQDGKVPAEEGSSPASSPFWDSIFTVKSTVNSSDVYLVEQLTVGEDNTVEILASEFPCTDSLVSKIAQDIADPNIQNFSVT